MSDLLQRTAALSPEKLALLQRRLKKTRNDEAAPGSPARISRRDGQGPAPLSFAQERMWFIDRLQPGSPAYNISESFPFQGPLDAAVLERCLAEIERRHEVLRTRFGLSQNGLPVQIVEPGPFIELPVADLSPLPEEHRQAEFQRLAAHQVRHSFDLATLPLWDALLVRLGTFRGAEQHVLLLTFHHIVSDAWSMGVFYRELAVLYKAFLSGRPSPLPELPLQYADFAVWQREWLQGARLEKLLGYWKERLAGAPALLALPTDRPRPAVQSFRGGLRSFMVPAPLHRELKALGHRERTTLFMTLLAAFETLLHRYTGQDDLVLATPIANRGFSEIEGLIGFFLNTLVLRTNLGADPTFRQVMTRVREGMLTAHANQDLPFEKLVQELRPDRNLSINPLFQVMFVLQSAQASEGPAEETGTEPGASQTTAGTSRFDCTLSLVERGGRLAGVFEYNIDLFDSATVQRMEGHFLTLLGGIVDGPDRRLSELPLLSGPERQILAEWNDTERPYASGRCLHELVEARAAVAPLAPALLFGEERLTYGELNARANQVAHRLRALGVSPEVRVGLLLDRSVEIIVGLLGILKAGGAYVPLDPAYPAERLAFLMEDARVAALLTREERLARLSERPPRTLCVDADREAIAAESRENPASGVTPDHPAYVIYTSGSTGRPKGVVVPHRGTSNAAEVEVAVYRMRPDDRVLQFASLNFDASVFELLMCFGAGATLCLGRREDLLPGPELARFLRERSITVLPIPPSALAAVPVCELPDLRLILVMGEACPEELVERWQPMRFFNAYGPTEATIWSAGTYLEPGYRTTIGRPLANASIHLLDRSGQPVPIGVSGELHIGGVGVTRGYLNRPDLTAGRFTPDPFSGSPGARLYRTGDLARYFPGGEIEFLGRIDHQVKIRGFRIELGEIESVLSRCPGVRETVVTAREDLPSGKGLVAYVAVDPRRAPTTSDLRRFLQDHLPDYMVPVAFVLLDALPLTPSGKFDRAALPVPDASRPELTNAFVAPRTSTEEWIARIWAEVLGLEKVGVNDDFFDLGGHSLLATQIVSRVRDVFRVEIPLRRIFEAVTVRELAALVEQRLAATPVAAAPSPVLTPSRAGRMGTEVDPGALTEEEVDSWLRRLLVGQKRELLTSLLKGRAPVPSRIAPASFSQERLWFLDRLRPGNPAYNIPAGIPLPPAADLTALARALNEVVRRHEVLRTTFALERDRPVQVIAPALTVSLPVIDLRPLSAGVRQAELGRVTAERSALPFDLARGPLIRAAVVRLNEEEGVLFLTLPHIVADGWSMSILFHELGSLYEAFRAGYPLPLPELPLQYADFSRWQRDRLRGEELERQLSYWRNQLAGAPATLNLPLDHPRPAVSTRGGVLPFTLPADPIAGLKALAQQQGATLFMAVLTLVQALLWHHSRQDRILVGSPIANRTRSEFEGLIGFFANTLVLGADLTADPSFRRLLDQVRETTLGAYAHQDLPFERLVEELQPERAQNVNPLFQVMFLMDGGGTTPATADSPGSDPVPLATPTPTKFDLTFYLTDTGSGMGGAVEYDRDLFEDGTIRRLTDHLAVLLRRVMAEPDRPLSELSLLTGQERLQLARWNATDVRGEGPQTLHGLFEAQVRATPEAVAISSARGDLTYRDLEARAHRIAHRLRSLGVGPDTRVGICLERSNELFAGLLGILKAGGAYVPLDPEGPPERLEHLVRAAGVDLVLTREPLCPALPGEVRTATVEELVDAGDETPFTVEIDGRHLAYVIYTSGSTGHPKGVMVPHEAIVNHMRWLQGARPLTGDDVVLQKTPLHFDASVWEIFAPLAVGARLRLAQAGAHRDPALLVREMAGSGVTIVQVVPSLLHLLLDEPGLAGCTALRRLFCGGEILPAEDARRLLSLLGAELVNLYGPTEAAVDATFWICSRGEDRREVPIGRPIWNLRTHVLDRRLSEIPVGAVGELFLTGHGLARGYVGRPDLTAERFLPNPCAEKPGERLYRTGDMVRYLPGGELEFRGRADDQVKVRGVRVEPGEIEGILAGHPAVREAAVVVESAGSGRDVRLVAYFAPRDPEQVPAGAELRSWLERRLPRPMVPAAFLPIASLPRTATGKLDRKTLTASIPKREAREGIPLSAPLEEVLADIWAEVLHLEKVSADDDFFELGGHSLLAVQVLSRVRDALGVEWPLQRFFEFPTLAGMATALAGQESVEKQARALVELARLSDAEVRERLETLR